MPRVPKPYSKVKPSSPFLNGVFPEIPMRSLSSFLQFTVVEEYAAVLILPRCKNNFARPCWTQWGEFPLVLVLQSGCMQWISNSSSLSIPVALLFQSWPFQEPLTPIVWAISKEQSLLKGPLMFNSPPPSKSNNQVCSFVFLAVWCLPLGWSSFHVAPPDLICEASPYLGRGINLIWSGWAGDDVP